MRCLLLLAACTPQPGPGFSVPTPTPSVAGTWQGDEVDGGFGAAVAAAGARVAVGAPHGESGRLFLIDNGAMSEVLVSGGRMGAAVAVTEGDVWAAAPLRGEVVSASGEVVASGLGVGLSLATQGGAVVVATAEGWETADQRGSAGARPASVAVLDGAVGVGTPLGAAMLWVDGSAVPRLETGDEAGYALAVGDVDGDGEPEWVVGAPGARAIYVLSAAGDVEDTLSDDRRRFGHAVAVWDVDQDGVSEILVGAPLAGEAAGWAGLYAQGRLVNRWTGADPGDRLGWSVAALAGHVVLGAPGGPASPGRVRVEAWAP